MMSKISFESFGLAAPFLANVVRLGFTEPTTVQAQSIPAAMQGGDWMVSSQTGSGKTAAYLLPVLNAILASQAVSQGKRAATFAAAAEQPNEKGAPWAAGRGERTNSRKQRQGGRDMRFEPVSPQAIVLCPTRELAQQVTADAINFVHGLRGLRISTVVGGMPFMKQVAELQGASLVVATPGRLLDLQTQRKIRLDAVKYLVVDEADRMLDLGFAEDLERIATACAAREQTLMYSATFAPRIMKLASHLMKNPGRLELATAQDRHADITQTLHWADSLKHKRGLLSHWLRDASIEQALVFASTQIDTEALANDLIAEGFRAEALHGGMPQQVRNRRLQNLRDGRIKILVATDVAARGLDVASISHVINYGLPMKAEDYVHRIGRTGRAGRAGRAVTLAEFRERHKIRAIEQFTQQQLKVDVIAGMEPATRNKSSDAPRREFGRPGRSDSGFRTADIRPFNPAARRTGPHTDANGGGGGYVKPVYDKAPYEKSGFGKAAYEKPAYEKPAYAKPAYAKPAYAKADYAKIAYAKPAYVKPDYEKSDYAKPAFSKPGFVKTGYPKSVNPKSDFDRAEVTKSDFTKPAYAKPAFAKPAFGKPAFGKPAFGKSAFGKPAIAKPGYATPTDAKAAYAKSRRAA